MSVTAKEMQVTGVTKEGERYRRKRRRKFWGEEIVSLSKEEVVSASVKIGYRWSTAEETYF